MVTNRKSKQTEMTKRRTAIQGNRLMVTELYAKRAEHSIHVTDVRERTSLNFVVRLPAALVLGVRDALTRRLPAALTVAGVAIPMAMITIALACWSTD